MGRDTELVNQHAAQRSCVSTTGIRNAGRSDAEAGPGLGGALKAQVALKGWGPRNDSSVSEASGSQP